MNNLLLSLWFFLPAGLANAAPVFANKIPWLNRWHTPLDFGVSIGGKRLFGDHKTWRGLSFGVLIGILCCLLQRVLFIKNPAIRDIAYPLDYTSINVVVLGASLGAGALLGDAVESSLKRRFGIPSGHSWFPFDQLDYIIGGIIFSTLVVRLDLLTYISIIIVWFGIHLLVSYIGFLLKLKDKPI